MPGSKFVYVTYIRTTPEKLWQALIDPKFTKQYWAGTHQESDWKVGSDWKIMIPDGRVGDSGKVIEFDPPVAFSSENATTNKSRTPVWRPGRLKVSWRNEFIPELKAEGYTYCTYELEPAGSAVKLTVTHEAPIDNSVTIEKVSGGWPHVLASLKSLLETGESLVESRKWPEAV